MWSLCFPLPPTPTLTLTHFSHTHAPHHVCTDVCGSSEAAVLESLASGATGMWCGVSREGASVGHCSSTVTLLNLHRLGNKYIQSKYNLAALREAAVRVLWVARMLPLQCLASLWSAGWTKY